MRDSSVVMGVPLISTPGPQTLQGVEGSPMIRGAGAILGAMAPQGDMRVWLSQNEKKGEQVIMFYVLSRPTDTSSPSPPTSTTPPP